MRKRSSHLFALGVSVGLMVSVSAGLAQAETVKIGGPPPISGIYFAAQEELGIEPAFDEIKSGLDGYRFTIQYESGPPLPPRPETQPAPVRTKREARRKRSQLPQPSPKTTDGK